MNTATAGRQILTFSDDEIDSLTKRNEEYNDDENTVSISEVRLEDNEDTATGKNEEDSDKDSPEPEKKPESKAKAKPETAKPKTAKPKAEATKKAEEKAKDSGKELDSDLMKELEELRKEKTRAEKRIQDNRNATLQEKEARANLERELIELKKQLETRTEKETAYEIDGLVEKFRDSILEDGVEGTLAMAKAIVKELKTSPNTNKEELFEEWRKEQIHKAQEAYTIDYPDFPEAVEALLVEAGKDDTLRQKVIAYRDTLQMSKLHEMAKPYLEALDFAKNPEAYKKKLFEEFRNQKVGDEDEEFASLSSVTSKGQTVSEKKHSESDLKDAGIFINRSAI